MRAAAEFPSSSYLFASFSVINSAVQLSILYQDQDFVAVDKPSGLLVHRTELSVERVSAMTLLRDQLGQWVYPVHRLDRATSGVLVFALSSEAARDLAMMFQERKVSKSYYAIVRGYVAESGEINKALQESEDKDPVAALSRFQCVARVELSVAVGKKHATSRYSLVKVETETGRLHQVRKHLASVFHPIIGDTTYGDGRHNKYFRNELGVNRLLLHARELAFVHPRSRAEVRLKAPWPAEYNQLFERFGWTQTLMASANREGASGS